MSLLLGTTRHSHAFVPRTGYLISARSKCETSSHLHMSSKEKPKERQHLNDDDIMDDKTLLETVTTTQMKDLCKQSNVSTDGTKKDMLLRLRDYAQKEAQLDYERQKRLIQKVNQGADDTQGNGRAKYRIIKTEGINESQVEDEDELEGEFYFALPGKDKKLKKQKHKSVTISKSPLNPQNSPLNSITAPLPHPGQEPDKNGERVVTTYSSTDQNDLTGIAAQSSSSSANDAAMMGGYSRSDAMGSKPEDSLAGGPFGDQSGSQRRKASSKEYEEASDILRELIQSLLSMTGAPGFQDEFAEGIVPFDEIKKHGKDGSAKTFTVSNSNTRGFVGFDPSRVPSAMITQSSRALRVGNGDALREILGEFEIQAIGFDGMAADNKEKGGGHYLEVQKISTFLEGFRKAEVRRVARETATMLLDKLISEGVKGLDQMLMVMTRGSDDSSDAGELNDSLLSYLEDAIRQQQAKVDQIHGTSGVMERSLSRNPPSLESKYDNIDLWNVTVGEDGERVESLDPNDPEVKRTLEREGRNIGGKTRSLHPQDPAQQLLLLLTLLKERVKAEAVFTNDEKGRNLRVLAYCLHAAGEKEREAVIMDHLGLSLDVS